MGHCKTSEQGRADIAPWQSQKTDAAHLDAAFSVEETENLHL